MVTCMNKELIEKAEEAKSVDELLKLAKENKVELSKEKAQEIFSRLHCEGELVDDELDSVSGGGCGIKKPEGAKYSIGQVVNMKPYEFVDYGKYQWCRYCTLGDNKAEIVEYLWMTDYTTLQKVIGAWNGRYVVRCLGCGATQGVDEDEILGV